MDGTRLIRKAEHEYGQGSLDPNRRRNGNVKKEGETFQQARMVDRTELGLALHDESATSGYNSGQVRLQAIHFDTHRVGTMVFDGKHKIW